MQLLAHATTVLYILLMTITHGQRENIWYYKMDSASAEWTGTPSVIASGGANCPNLNGKDYCWDMNSQSTELIKSAGSGLDNYHTVQLMYSLSTSGVSVTKLCVVEYSTDGTNFNDIFRTTGSDIAPSQHNDQVFSIGNPSSLTIKLTSSGGNTHCYFNEFAISGVPITSDPTKTPSRSPSDTPSATPTDAPSKMPSATPTDSPSKTPSTTPTKMPSTAPSKMPSASPTTTPTTQSNPPSATPTDQPTKTPSAAPSKMPSAAPTDSPSKMPSAAPSKMPSAAPTDQPSAPSNPPSAAPSGQPSKMPSAAPSSPTNMPSATPTAAPTVDTLPISGASGAATIYRVTVSAGGTVLTVNNGEPIRFEIREDIGTTVTVTITYNWDSRSSANLYCPGCVRQFYFNVDGTVHKCVSYGSGRYYTAQTMSVSYVNDGTDRHINTHGGLDYGCRTVTPSNGVGKIYYVPPTPSPTEMPSVSTSDPTYSPSADPTTGAPTQQTLPPTGYPSVGPTFTTSNPTTSEPTRSPTSDPSTSPTFDPTTVTASPTVQTSDPSFAPSKDPTVSPTSDPSSTPTSGAPTSHPSAAPSKSPTGNPSSDPTSAPTSDPTTTPTASTSDPSVAPSEEPTVSPSSVPPTTSPTDPPTSALCERANSESNAWCYTQSVSSSSWSSTSSFTVNIYNSYGGDTEIYDVYFTAWNGPCFNPSINVSYVSLDNLNALSILDGNGRSVANCQKELACGEYSQCVTNRNLGMEVLQTRKTYQLTLFGRNLVNECGGSNTIDAKVEFVCDVMQTLTPTLGPIEITPEPTEAIVLTPEPTDAPVVGGDSFDAANKLNMNIIISVFFVLYFVM